MSKKLYASSLLIVALAAITLFAIHATPNTAGRPASSAESELSALPASDIVLFVDAQKILNDSVPNFFATNPSLISKINAKLDEMKSQTGVDMRSFDSFAIGFKFTETARFDSAHVVALSRGHFNADEVIAAGLASAKTKCNISAHEEQFSGRTVYIFKPVGSRNANCPQAGNVPAEEFAVAAYDANTIVSGDVESVRAALDSNSPRVSSELVDLATRTPDAVMSWGGNLPPGVSARLDPRMNHESDAMSRSIAAIRQFYGSVRVAGVEADTFIGLRTETADQAQEISHSLNSLKMVSKLGIRNNSGNLTESASLTKLLENLSISTESNEVQIKMKVAQSDIAPFMR
ncbi:MAG: hypothetical protein AUG51_02160 [Acidobacteria bacterium 13_1_20CM_3_53_8]|nr:MAG: hypothetical protein AUG51_02160 [Acidobacteria bacterium 13_1_20CM_3_53_8]